MRNGVVNFGNVLATYCEDILGSRCHILARMLRRRRIPEFTGKQAVPHRIECLASTHTNRESTPDERIVLVRLGRRRFWGILLRMLDVFSGHQEYLCFAVAILSEMDNFSGSGSGRRLVAGPSKIPEGEPIRREK
jgi:hypothetical protein